MNLESWLIKMNKIALGAKVELSRRFFFDYCNLIMPSFYKHDRQYLVDVCEAFQNFLDDDEHDVLGSRPLLSRSGCISSNDFTTIVKEVCSRPLLSRSGCI